jgi:hypothetical protein
MRLLLLLAVILSMAGTPAAGQVRPRPVASAEPAQLSQAQSTDPWRNGGSAALGAIVGGGLGLVAGVAASSVFGQSCEELECLGVAILGGAVGSALGIGIGAHVGNGRRGNALATVGASLGVLLVAAAVGSAGDMPGELLLAVPLGQIVAAVVTEVEVGKARRTR